MRYEFFWSGPFSQWATSPFTSVDGIDFLTAEQYMMYQKAILFDDQEIAEKVLQTSDPKKQKQLGRKVKNFNVIGWNKNARRIVYEGNLLKFSQNKKMYKLLMSTEDRLLVEASPFDKIWGIGLDENAARITPEVEWLGTNWLGLELTNVREYFKMNPIIFN